MRQKAGSGRRSAWVWTAACLLLVPCSAFLSATGAARAGLKLPVQVRSPLTTPTANTGRVVGAVASPSTAGVPEQQDPALGRALDAVKDYVNAKHGEELVKFLRAFTPLGDTLRSKNFWSGDAFSITGGRVTRLDLQGMAMVGTCLEKDFFGREKTYEQQHEVRWTDIGLQAPSRPSDVKRCLIAMCNAVDAERATGSIFSVPVDDDRWVIPHKLFLNNVPHTRFARQFFYNSVLRAVLSAVEDRSCPRRMNVKCLIPETNPSFDTYRIGTVLELVRDMALAFIARGYRVKVCVQGKLGQGVFVGLPISLNGCRIILENMDWQSEEGEEQEGIIGSKLFFGEIGPEVVEPEDDIFLLISPQNLIGASLMPMLEAMADKAGDRPFILLNPNLADRPSSNNLMQIRGREERGEFVKTFHDVFVFETQHDKGLFKIIGAKGRAGHNQPWVTYRLSDNQETLQNINERYEDYEPMRVSEQEPQAVIL